MNSIGSALVKRRATDRMVVQCEDFRRIAALPRRTEFEDLSAALTAWLGKPGCTRPLWRDQGWALQEMVKCRGLVGSLEVSGGKFLISVLAPVVLEAQRPVLIVPAGLMSKTLDISIPDWAKDYYLHPNLKVISYNALGVKKNENLLNELMPDLIIADECHRLKNKGAGVTRRVSRYMDRYPGTMFVGVSGTLTRKSINEYAHIIKWALKERSPLPHSWTSLVDWSDVLDELIPEEMRPHPGALLMFCEKDARGLPKESVQNGFRRRLNETEGYIFTAAPRVDVSLRIREYPVKVPDEVKEVVHKMRSTEQTPAGDIITSGLELSGHMKELCNGFWNKWVWPTGRVDNEWLQARKKWRSFARKCIKNSGQSSVGNMVLDTHAQVVLGVQNGRITCPEDEYNHWQDQRQRWLKTYGVDEPKHEVVWVSEFMVDEIMDWMEKAEKRRLKGEAGAGLVWVWDLPLMAKLRERGAICYASGNDDVNYETKTCALSVSHREGKDLQKTHSQNFYTRMLGGLEMEQTLGRTHRNGQEQDEVEADIPLHAIELWDSYQATMHEARKQLEMYTRRYKLLTGDVTVSSEMDIIRKVRALPKDPMWVKEWAATKTLQPVVAKGSHPKAA